MNNRTPISNELKLLAPGLEYLPVAMPYTVPQGYFENLTDYLVSIIKNEDFPLQLSTVSKKMPYQVPAAYFDNLAQEILGKVRIRQTVPEGYFETLPALLLSKVRKLEVSQELETVAPLLNNISKEPVQFVPQGYFEQLEPLVTQQTTQRPPVISIKKKTSWLKYAAAASIIFFLSFGAYRYFNNDTTIEGFTTVPADAVKAFDKQLAQLDDATIEKYLQENESVTETNAGWYKNTEDANIENLLQNFTEQELQQQLLENPGVSTPLKPKKT